MEAHREQEELTLKDIIIQINDWQKYLLRKWYLIILFTGLGLAIGFFVSHFSKKKFIADSTFVLEGVSSNSGGLGSALGLSGENNTGLFTSLDNIIWLYGSNELITNTLLSPAGGGQSKDDLLINLFTKTSTELQNEINKRPAYQDVYLTTNDINNLTDLHIQYIRLCLSVLKKNNLLVEKVEKTENIVSVKVEAEDEEFAYYFNKALVENVNKFYIESKTKKQRENVEKLTIKADTLRASLDKNMYQVAQSADMNPFPNPHLRVLNVEPQKQNVDVQVLSNLYIQTTQNLEIAKNELAKETPIIQIVDEPNLPLPARKFSLTKALIIGGVLGFMIIMLYLVASRIYRDAISSKPALQSV